jgi:carbamoyltransferase
MGAAGFHQLGSDFADHRIARIREKLGRGRHIGVEMSVNTSFNVAGPIAQTPQQAIDTLRRSKGLDVVLLVAGDGTVHAAWHGGERDSGRFTGWLSAWKSARG